MMKDRFVFRETVTQESPLVSYLSERTSLSKTQIKRLLNSGAVWIRRKNMGKKLQRIRRAQATVYPGDYIELYFSRTILSEKPLTPQFISDEKEFTVWNKPPNMLTQGTKFGDHTSLVRFAEKQLRKPVYLVHRLDRETSGLVLLAHTPSIAAEISQLFRAHSILKVYLCRVQGDFRKTHPPAGTIDLPLDGKRAVTHYEASEYDASSDTTLITITPQTGRYHQIRRHLALSGFPIIGDQRYGGKPAEILALTAVHLRFQLPGHRGKTYEFSLSPEQIPWMVE